MGIPSVFIAMPVHRPLPIETVTSLLNTTALLRHRGVAHTVEFQQAGAVVENRTVAASRFLTSGMDRLFFIDSDMSWDAESVLRLLELSKRMDVVIGGYTAKCDPPRLDFNFEGSLIAPNRYGCIPINGHGLGFTVIRREVMKALAGAAPKVLLVGGREKLPGIFRFEYVDGQLWGEDMLFFRDIKRLGFQVWLDPEVQLGHIGPREYTVSVKAWLETVSRKVEA